MMAASIRDSRASQRAFCWFIVDNLLISLIAFPIICCCGVLAFWQNEIGLAATVAVTSLLHLVGLIVGLAIFRKARYFVIPFLSTAAFVFLFNCHTQGVPDDSPFSDGIGTVDQHRWGVTGYYRVFDEPFGAYGKTHFDWVAVFIGLEFTVLLTVITGVAVLGIVSLWQWLDAVSNDDSPLVGLEDSTQSGRRVIEDLTR